MPQPRLLRPKDDNNNTSDSNETTNEAKSGKRRAISSACIPCRKRKSKCDGGVPACSTCVAVYRTECTYDPESDHRRKVALKKDIQSLQQQNDALDVIVASLRTLPEQDAVSLLHSLRTGTKPDAIAASLRSSVNLPATYAAQTLEADFAQQIGDSGASTSASDPSLSSTFSTAQERAERDANNLGAASWFRTPQDMDQIEHLLELYFSWVHPFHQFFSKEHFIFDFRNGRTENCGVILINAILAFACHYSDRPLSRSNYFNPATAGDSYYSEARAALDVIEKPTLTTVQALAILSLRETSQGRDSNGYRFAGRAVRMAIEMNLHLPLPANGHPLDAELRKLSFWGVFNLENISAVGFQKFSFLSKAVVSVDMPAAIERIEAQQWKAYDDTDISNTANPQALQPISFTNCLSQLCEIASEMTNTFYASKDKFNTRALAAMYTRYQDWYKSLPESFWLENTTLPHVIVLHMSYNFCILHLFRPYIKLNLAAAELHPRDACTDAASQISGLMNILRAMYGLRRVPVTVVNFLLSASTIHLLMLPSESSATNLVQAMHDLQAMSVNHPFAARSLSTIRTFGAKWGITLPSPDTITSSIRFQSMIPVSPTTMMYSSPVPRQQSSGSSGRQPDGPKHESPFDPPDTQDNFDVAMFTQALQTWPTMPGAMMQQQFDFEEAMPGWNAYAAGQQHDIRRQSAPEQPPNDQSQAEQLHWQWKR